MPNNTPSCTSDLYPGIKDTSALKLLQLIYRFREHQFLGLQWKSLQEAGWTHSGGKYKSPGGTRIFDTPNAVQDFLDLDGIQPVFSDLQVDAELEPSLSSADRAVDDEGMESAGDLRNAVCYQMQLLIEKGSGDDDDATNDDDDEYESTTAVGESANVNDDDTFHNSRRSSLRRSTRTTAAEPAASVTTTDKGSNLYLQKKTKGSRRKSKLQSKRPADEINNDNEDLVFPTLEECVARIQQCDLSAVEEIEVHYKNECFEDWCYQLSTNHSLLFYGVGSKYELLKTFCETVLDQEGYTVRIDGFDADVTIDGILDLLVSLFLDGKEPDPKECHGLFLRQIENEPDLTGVIPEIHNFCDPITVVDRAVFVTKALTRLFAKTLMPLFLVIHNIDGTGLRTDVAQNALAAIVMHSVPEGTDVPAIRLIASLDDVDASAALWSSATAFNFRWIRKEVNTFRPYIRELALLPDEDVATKKAARKKKRATQQAGRVLEVLKNLAPRYGEVMQVLAKLQMKELKSSSNSPWVDYKVFRADCKSSFLIDKESKLRSLLSELKDHRLILSKTEGSSEYVSIPYDDEKLKEILAYKRSS